jgi:hypothetical protein
VGSGYEKVSESWGVQKVAFRWWISITSVQPLRIHSAFVYQAFVPGISCIITCNLSRPILLDSSIERLNPSNRPPQNQRMNIRLSFILPPSANNTEMRGKYGLHDM